VLRSESAKRNSVLRTGFGLEALAEKGLTFHEIS